MTVKKSDQISASGCVCSQLGVHLEQDGITFSAAVSPEKKASLILYRRGSGEIVKEIPFPEASHMGMVRAMKVTGITPEKFEYNFRIGEQVTTDPAARLVRGREKFGDRSPRGEHQVRCGFLTERFDWGEEQAPDISYEDGIMYQLHVRGFTKQKNSGVRHKGTFLGVQEKIPYLKDLGINQVVLLPACEFDEIMEEERIGAMGPDPRTVRRLNYWGFTRGNYFAPKCSYSATGKPDVEFKTMVREFHKNHMEVIMEFCFPDPVDIKEVNDCLVWWVQEYHVDGFHLFLNSEAAAAVARNPFLAGVKLMAGYFPEGSGLPMQKKYLAECNDGFKESARRMLKGDEDQLTAFVGRMKYNPGDRAVINYITNHDGFTLMDLVSYDKKHNEENGEQGRDGAVYNYSWNCGLEGPTRKRAILQLRMRQMKNALAMVLLAQGTPLLLAGDEFGNSQQGNNNPYCHDSELAWVDWSREKSGQKLREFVKALIAFRREHRILHMKKELTGSDFLSCGYPDFSCHGSRAWYGDFEYTNRHVGMMYCGTYADHEEFVYVAFNSHWNFQKLALPYLPEGMSWRIVFDTSEQDETAEEAGEQEEALGKIFEMPPRCMRVLVGMRQTEDEPQGNRD